MIPVEMFWKKKRVVLSLQVLAGICMGCARCINRCRKNVFIMGHMDSRPVAAIHMPDACNGCGKCLNVCKAEAIELITDE